MAAHCMDLSRVARLTVIFYLLYDFIQEFTSDQHAHIDWLVEARAVTVQFSWLACCLLQQWPSI